MRGEVARAPAAAGARPAEWCPAARWELRRLR